MSVRTAIPVVLWSVLIGGVVAVSAYLVLDWMLPGDVSIGPAIGGEIVVHVDGAVATPAVVRLPAGSRLQAAIAAAGGLTADADVTSLNLAARIGDGEHIVIPERSSPATPPAAGSSAQPAEAANALIDINAAGPGELERLPGVGPAIAQRIIDYRETNGPFQSIEELDEIDGISSRMVEELRPLVTLGE